MSSVAVIRGMSSEPHVQHVKKCDPVARYQSYQHSWMSCRAPGDKAHKQLRWGVREKMLCHDQVIDKVDIDCLFVLKLALTSILFD